ncbi:DUF1688-domain-containing protein [Basidiobolus meristosporus CBS 931.73]|uniref:DUF1688-domain-containing protein n=1 Tax=Basidiobolus meristosporus CBS 931.73 TaxID=1314790 RepID=A0A1Y1YX63_9FUNG|nr:DUF1688-domain-containing protein [Basidiobolus meristosporus CBS 931.73]|eukprot:ORY02648.1 DUF1688-domain-containing protein [Basidiobolus meristosporus CBS 931.73]
MEAQLKESIAYLKTLTAVRERSQQIFDLVTKKDKGHFAVHLNKLENVADFVLDIIMRDYDSPKEVPPHSRWRHFDVGGVPRVQQLIDSWSGKAEKPELTRRILDLFVVSVLLDAGAGNVWTYKESSTGSVFNRSEGLAIASLAMFNSGAFSSDPNQPYQVDAAALRKLTVGQLSDGFQVSEKNPLEGLQGRCELLNRLGEALQNNPQYFGKKENGEPRPGNLLDYLLSIAKNNLSVPIDRLWEAVITGFSQVWPSTRTVINGESLGDVWPSDILKGIEGKGLPTDELVPFHKLSQWLTYSLMEPMTKVMGIKFEQVQKMTGLPEYRNGGLFVDLGVLTLKDNDQERGLAQSDQSGKETVPKFAPFDPVVVEWRALTIVLLDMTAEKIREKLGVNSEELQLASILEGGTWKAGREIAAQLRPQTKGPPIAIVSDGTVF